MKQILLLILFFSVFTNSQSQGIELLYKGGGTSYWNDPVNWIQINTPSGQTPIQRIPTELDDVVFNSSLSGLTTVLMYLGNQSSFDSIEVGGSSVSGYRCKSIHVSNTNLSLGDGTTPNVIQFNIYTANGGYVLIDSGSNFHYGHFQLHGGNSQVKDLEIVHSIFGSLFSQNDWSTVELFTNGKARFLGSTLGGYFFGSKLGGELYAENCTFNTTSFVLGDNSSAIVLNCPIQNDPNNSYMNFHIGRNANFVSNNVNVSSFNFMDFYTSGSVLNGNVSVEHDNGYAFNFTQEDTLNPLPNIINGNLVLGGTSTMGITGEVKISGNFVNNAADLEIYPDTSHVQINSQDIFKIGGIRNYSSNVTITNCLQQYCHFSLEFLGNTNSNIYWPVGFPVDTLIINKSGCAKVTATNSLYVSGEAKIKSGQLVLIPNASIPYKFVCAGDLNIFQGGGVLLGKNSAGLAKIAVQGAINDYNTVVDSNCTGLSNPYNSEITLYRQTQGSNHSINITSTSNIGNLNLNGIDGSNFILGGNLIVNDISFVNNGKLLLGNYNLIVNGNIINSGPTNYFVTNGLGKLQLNNIGNIERLFPIGPATNFYNPASILNSGTADNFMMNVQPQVLSGGTSGNPYVSGVVNRTWNVEESTPGGSDVTLKIQWNATDELPGFTRNNSFLSHYISGAWNMGPQTSAIGSDPYTLSRSNITGFSPFAVMGTSSIVPIVLLDFSVRYQDKAISLEWSTGNESNTEYFIIEKSYDQVSFEPLINIRASGNSSGKKNYHFRDETFLKPIIYYRLKMVDKDGKYNYSKIIKINIENKKGVFSVSPNPTKDVLSINTSVEPGNAIIKISDELGRNLKEFKIFLTGTSPVLININDLPKGTYNLLLRSKTISDVIKFVKR
jgi:hypothetical protein